MPPRKPDSGSISRPPRGDGAAPRRPPPERVTHALKCLLGDPKKKSRKLHTYSETIASLMEAFGVSRATAERDVQEARLRCEADAKQHVTFLRTLKTKELEEISHEARGADEYQAAVAAIRELCKLNGAYEPERIEHTFLTDEECAEELEDLKAEAIAELDTAKLIAELERRGLRVHVEQGAPST